MASSDQEKTESVSDEGLAQDAYERVKADLAALMPDDLLAVNLSIPAGVSMVLGLLPGLRVLRDRMVKELPSFDPAAFDKLEDYALALSFTHTNYLTMVQPPDDSVQFSS